MWLYVATIVERRTRCVVAHAVVEERTFDTLQPLVDQVFAVVPQVKQFYSDGLSTYQELAYCCGHKRAGHQVVDGKRETYSVEGTNADLRCYVPPLDRRGRCFPRNTDNFRALLRLFLFCYNRCCLARLKHPNYNYFPSDFLPPLF